jgi:hypothetical protein
MPKQQKQQNPEQLVKVKVGLKEKERVENRRHERVVMRKMKSSHV